MGVDVTAYLAPCLKQDALSGLTKIKFVRFPDDVLDLKHIFSWCTSSFRVLVHPCFDGRPHHE